MKETKHQHFIIYKPYGYLSQFISNDVKSHKKRYLGELHDFPKGLMAVGRLDEKSEGLLVLTTNGKLSNTVNSAKFEKEYYALVDGHITQEALNKIETGVEIGFEGKKYQTKPCKVKKIETTPQLPIRSKKVRDNRHGPTTWISVILTEGKFRQVRKMTAAVGFPTLRLVRVRVNTITLETMKVGEIQKIDESKLLF